MCPSAPRVWHRRCRDCDLDRQYPFCPLPEPLRPALDAIKTSVAYVTGQRIFDEADVCRSIFILCEGSVKLVTASAEGKVLLLRFAGAGETLGIAEALLGTRYECTAIAAKPSVLGVIPSETFLRFVRSYPETRVRLTQALSEQYKTAQEETRFLAFGETSAARLARLLLNWSAQRGEAGRGARIPSRLTHMELAESIGSTRETVTRILGDLKHRGIVERTRDGILIRNEEELSRLLTD